MIESPATLSWQKRETPLALEGCLVEGRAAEEFARKLKRPETSRLRLAVLDSGRRIIALGSEPPWVEGALFLGREGHVYMPTTWQPNLPVEWLEASLYLLGEPPWLLLPDGTAIGLSKAATR